MKYVVVLPDGAADEPVADLDGLTPLQAAHTPNIDWVSTNGRQGRCFTVPKGFQPASDVATLSLFGYDPNQYYNGRAPFEAAAQGIKTTADQLIFRCNFVTLADGHMEDFTAGHIAQNDAEQLIKSLNDEVADERCTFHPGVSYRNLLIVSDAEDMAPLCTAPHDIPGQPAADFLPGGPGSDYLRDLMDRAADMLVRHDVNVIRADLSENPATNIWLWGQGKPVDLPAFVDRFHQRGVLIAAVDLIRGIAIGSGMDLINVPGATGYLDTDYAGKGQAAVQSLGEYDIVMVHIEAPDEAGHLGDAGEKVKAIERVDEHVVGPLLETIRQYDQWRMLIAPDHPTPVEKRVHTDEPPPFCLAGTAIHPVLGRPFSEANARESDLQINPGHDLMEYFIRV